VDEIYKTQTKALSAYHALFAATKRPRPRPSPAPQCAKHIGETVRVLTGPCTGHIGEITAVDGPSPISFRVQFAAPVRCAKVGEVAAVWKTMGELQFVDEPMGSGVSRQGGEGMTAELTHQPTSNSALTGCRNARVQRASPLERGRAYSE
jgi:hypothetical protein